MKEENNYSVGIEDNSEQQDIKTIEQQNEAPKIEQINLIETKSIKKKDNGKIVFASILLVIVLILFGIISVIAYQEYNNPKNRFLKAVNGYLDKNNIADIGKIITYIQDGGTIDINGNININSNNAGINSYTNSYGADLKIIDNEDTKEQYLNLTVNSENQELFNFESISKDNKIYMTINEIFDDYYYTDFQYINLFNNQDKIKNNIMNSLNEYFTKEKFIKIKEENVDKITINLSERNLMELYIKIYENIINDEVLFEEIFNETLKENIIIQNYEEEITLEKFKELLKEEIDDVKEQLNSSSTDILFTYNIYLKGSKLLKQEIIVNQIKLIIEGITEGNITIINENETILTGTYNTKEIVLNYQNETDSLKITYKHNTEINDKINMNNNIIINALMYGRETDINIDLNVELTKNNKIPNIDISNAKDINDISEEETKKLYSLLSGSAEDKGSTDDIIDNDFNVEDDENINDNNYEETQKKALETYGLRVASNAIVEFETEKNSNSYLTSQSYSIEEIMNNSYYVGCVHVKTNNTESHEVEISLYDLNNNYSLEGTIINNDYSVKMLQGYVTVSNPDIYTNSYCKNGI